MACVFTKPVFVARVCMRASAHGMGEYESKCQWPWGMHGTKHQWHGACVSGSVGQVSVAWGMHGTKCQWHGACMGPSVCPSTSSVLQSGLKLKRSGAFWGSVRYSRT